MTDRIQNHVPEVLIEAGFTKDEAGKIYAEEKGKANPAGRLARNLLATQFWLERGKNKLIIDPKTEFIAPQSSYKVVESFLERHNQPESENDGFGVIKADLVKFSWWNDLTAEHLFGDWLLISFGKVVRMTLKKTDTAIRAGGEEFIFLIKGNHGQEVAERLLQNCQEKTIKLMIERHIIADQIRHYAEDNHSWAEVEQITSATKAFLGNIIALYQNDMTQSEGHSVLARDAWMEKKGTQKSKQEVIERICAIFDDPESSILDSIKIYHWGKGDKALLLAIKDYLQLQSWSELERQLKDIVGDRVWGEDLSATAIANRISLKEKMEIVVLPLIIEKIFGYKLGISLGLVNVEPESLDKFSSGKLLAEAEALAVQSKNSGSRTVRSKNL